MINQPRYLSSQSPIHRFIRCRDQFDESPIFFPVNSKFTRPRQLVEKNTEATGWPSTMHDDLLMARRDTGAVSRGWQRYFPNKYEQHREGWKVKSTRWIIKRYLRPFFARFLKKGLSLYTKAELAKKNLRKWVFYQTKFINFTYNVKHRAFVYYPLTVHQVFEIS